MNYNFDFDIYIAKRIYRMSLYRDTTIFKKVYYEILRLNLSGCKREYIVIISVKELDNNINKKLRASRD